MGRELVRKHDVVVEHVKQTDERVLYKLYFQNRKPDCDLCTLVYLVLVEQFWLAETDPFLLLPVV